jgi:hypothetical protein
MIGSGPGLTPLCDDFLCGYIFAEQINFCIHNNKTGLTIKFYKNILKEIKKTSFVSAGLLRYSLAGFFPEPFFFMFPDFKKFILNYGHSSGPGAASALLWTFYQRKLIG